jgi:hypothetical protein
VVWQFHVGHRSAPVDTSRGTTLDLNGDGFADLAISGQNKTHVYLGSAAGLPSLPSVSLDEPDIAGSLASAGDINGDGFADLAVGEPSDHNDRGAVFVYLGGPTGVAPTASFKLVGPDSNSAFGATISAAGDLDEDGYADLVIGAPSALLTQGAAYIFRGVPQGFAAEPTLTLFQPDKDSYFGYSLASGDIDGDGHTELFISAAYGEGGRGVVYMYTGGPLGVLGAMGPTPVLTQVGTGPQDLLGTTVSTADINGDGLADLVVGTYIAVNNHGIANVYLGRPGFSLVTPDQAVTGSLANGGGVRGSLAGDLDGDGFDDIALLLGPAFLGQGSVDVLRGGPTGLTPVTTISNTDPARYLEAVGRAGDLDGDGYSDLAIGTPSAQNSSTTGVVKVYRGGAQGLSPAPATTLGTGETDSYFGSTISGG